MIIILINKKLPAIEESAVESCSEVVAGLGETEHRKGRATDSAEMLPNDGRGGVRVAGGN